MLKRRPFAKDTATAETADTPMDIQFLKSKDRKKPLGPAWRLHDGAPKPTLFHDVVKLAARVQAF